MKLDSNSNRTFTITPAAELSYASIYKIKVTAAAQDVAGNNLASEYITSTGITTISEPVYVTSIEINNCPFEPVCEETSSKTATTFTVSATAYYNNGTSQTVSPTWSISPSYASVNSNGLVTISPVTSDRSFTLYATYSYGGATVSDSRSVTIINKYVNLLTIVDDTDEIDEGESYDFNANATYGPSSCSCTDSNVSATWSLSNYTYSSVNSSGTVSTTAVSSDRTVTLTASYPYGGQTRTDNRVITINDYDIYFSLACSRDTTLLSSEPSTSHANNTYLQIENSSVQARSLLFFDIFNIAEIPVGSSIKSAFLRVYPYFLNSFTTASIYRTQSDWLESVTWNTSPGYGSPYVTSSPSSAFQYWYIDVRDIVQTWVDGSYNNYGFYILTSSGATLVYSSEANQYQPVLQVTYSIEP